MFSLKGIRNSLLSMKIKTIINSKNNSQFGVWVNRLSQRTSEETLL